VHSVPNSGVTGEMATHSFSVNNCNWYVVSKGSETFTALINLDSHFSQAIKTEEVSICIKLVFQGTITGYSFKLLLFISH
jgi:hypothetical protein